MDGPTNPHDILAVLGEKELSAYLVNEIQEVYRLQGVGINDKHIEVIVRQMLRKVRVSDNGDTKFMPAEQVEKFDFEVENDRVIAEGGTTGYVGTSPPRYHESIALDRFMDLGGFVPRGQRKFSQRLRSTRARITSVA